MGVEGEKPPTKRINCPQIKGVSSVHQIADRLRVECIVLNCFFGSTKKKTGIPVCSVRHSSGSPFKTRLIKYRVHLHRGPYYLIASSADARGVDNFWAVAAQFYFDGAGLSCGAMKIRRWSLSVLFAPACKMMRIRPLSCFFDLRSIYPATVTVSNT